MHLCVGRDLRLTGSRDLLHCLFSKVAINKCCVQQWGTQAAPERQPAPTSIMPFFSSESRVWTVQSQLLLRCLKRNPICPPSPTPDVSECETNCMLKKAVTIIPLHREKLAPSCTGCYMVQRDRCTRSDTGETTEVFTSVGALRVRPTCSAYN